VDIQDDEEARRVLIWLKEGKARTLLPTFFQTINETYGPGTAQAIAASAHKPARRSFVEGLIDASKVPAGKPPKKLWFGMYEGGITLFNGQSGAGKSTILYSVALHAARNEPLFDIAFGLGRPLRVLSIDPENAGHWDEGKAGICGMKLDRLAGEDRSVLEPLFLKFHDGRGLNLADAACVGEISDYMVKERVDLLIVDPVANLFATKDENDNAEAARQMALLTQLKQETNACILVCHHTGKDESSGTRGASARDGAADVVMTFRLRREQEDDIDDDFRNEITGRRDLCRLRLHKNRMEDYKASMFLEMEGRDKFRVATFADWKNTARRNSASASEEEKLPKLEQAKRAILTLLDDDKFRSADEIVAILHEKSIGNTATDTALKELAKGEKIARVKLGQAYFYSSSRMIPKQHNNDSTKENNHYYAASEMKNGKNAHRGNGGEAPWR
jgi:RecA-family ATPase